MVLEEYDRFSLARKLDYAVYNENLSLVHSLTNDTTLSEAQNMHCLIYSLLDLLPVCSALDELVDVLSHTAS